MSIRAMVVVLLTLVRGLAAAAGMHQLRQPGAADGKPRTTPVILAVLDLPRDHVIEAEDVRVVDWPKGLAPEGAVHKLEDAVGRSTLLPMLKGEPVLEATMATGKSGRGLAALVPKGMRAYTIMTSRVASGVAGFVLPGNRVDVLLNLRTNQNDDAGGGPRQPAGMDVMLGKSTAVATATATTFVQNYNGLSKAPAPTVHIPPTSGPYAGMPKYVEVIVSSPVKTFLIHVLPGGPAAVDFGRATSVAGHRVMFYVTGANYNAVTGAPDNTDPSDPFNQSPPSNPGTTFSTMNLDASMNFTPIDSTAYVYNAPGIDAFNGMLVYYRRANTSGFELTGNASTNNLPGTFYAKWGTLTLHGLGKFGIQFVVDKLNFTGNGNVTINNTGNHIGKAPQVFLVE